MKGLSPLLLAKLYNSRIVILALILCCHSRNFNRHKAVDQPDLGSSGYSAFSQLRTVEGSTFTLLAGASSHLKYTHPFRG